tara:strand:- start:571 stop:1752 length:1182 start_codon:yes stop_codon:yes gene_type:complete
MPSIITKGCGAASGFGFGTAPPLPPLTFDNWEDLVLIPYKENSQSTADRLAFYDFVNDEFVHDIYMGSNSATQIFRHYGTGQLIYTIRATKSIKMIDLRTGDTTWEESASGYTPMPYAKDKIVSFDQDGVKIYAYTQTIGDDGLSSDIDSHDWFDVGYSGSITGYSNPDGGVAHEIDSNFEMEHTGNIYFGIQVKDESGSPYTARNGLGYINTSGNISSVDDDDANYNFSRPSGAHGEGWGHIYGFDGNKQQIFEDSFGTQQSNTSSGNGYIRGCGSRNSSYPIVKGWHYPYDSQVSGNYVGRTFLMKYTSAGGHTAIEDIQDSTHSQKRGVVTQTIPTGAIFVYQAADGTPKYKTYSASSDSMSSEQSFSGATWSTPTINNSNTATTSCMTY